MPKITLCDNPVTTITDALMIYSFPLLFINVIGISAFPIIDYTCVDRDFKEKITFSNGSHLCLTRC